MKGVLGSILFGALMAAAAARAADAPLSVTPFQLERQRLSGPTHVRAANGAEDGSVHVALDLVVGPEGKVVSTAPNLRRRSSAAAGDPQWLDQAQAKARGWRFRPFERGGRAVSATTTIHVQVLPPERPPTRRTAFPATTGMPVAVTLRRNGCDGACPDYSVTVHGDGRVRYQGLGDTLIEGVHEASIPIERVDRLVELFRTADFWSLDPAYRAPMLHGTDRELSFVAGGETKTVADHWGLQAGMPDSVRELQAAVDEAAGTARWVEGSDQTLASLEAEGFDFRSEQAASLLVRSIGRAPDSVALGLIDRGAPLDAPIYCHGCWEDSVHEAALMAAVVHGRPEIFDPLVSDDLLERMAELQRDELLLAAARVRSPYLVERMLAAGARMSASTYGGGSVLLHALNDHWELAADADLGALVRRLIARGAALEARDGIEWTALQHAYDEDPGIARLLLEAGADVNAGAPGGQPILYLTADEEIALIALAAGADRALKDMDGRGLAEIARSNRWSRVERLLAEPGPAALRR